MFVSSKKPTGCSALVLVLMCKLPKASAQKVQGVSLWRNRSGRKARARGMGTVSGVEKLVGGGRVRRRVGVMWRACDQRAPSDRQNRGFRKVGGIARMTRGQVRAREVNPPGQSTALVG